MTVPAGDGRAMFGMLTGAELPPGRLDAELRRFLSPLPRAAAAWRELGLEQTSLALGEATPEGEHDETDRAYVLEAGDDRIRLMVPEQLAAVAGTLLLGGSAGAADRTAGKLDWRLAGLLVEALGAALGPSWAVAQQDDVQGEEGPTVRSVSAALVVRLGEIASSIRIDVPVSLLAPRRDAASAAETAGVVAAGEMAARDGVPLQLSATLDLAVPDLGGVMALKAGDVLPLSDTLDEVALRQGGTFLFRATLGQSHGRYSVRLHRTTPVPEFEVVSRPDRLEHGGPDKGAEHESTRRAG